MLGEKEKLKKKRKKERISRIKLSTWNKNYKFISFVNRK